jgi:hypothetical protein
MYYYTKTSVRVTPHLEANWSSSTGLWIPVLRFSRKHSGFVATLIDPRLPCSDALAITRSLLSHCQSDCLFVSHAPGRLEHTVSGVFRGLRLLSLAETEYTLDTLAFNHTRSTLIEAGLICMTACHFLGSVKVKFCEMLLPHFSHTNPTLYPHFSTLY